MNDCTTKNQNKTRRWIAAPLPADPELARSSAYQGVYLEEGEDVHWIFDGAGRVMGYEIIKAEESDDDP